MCVVYVHACVHLCACMYGTFCLFLGLQVSQRDILNSIDREMSGDLREGFKTVGNSFSVHADVLESLS